MEDQDVNAIQSFEDFEIGRKIDHWHHHVQLAHFYTKIDSAGEITENIEC
jgi:hypothetical protein